MTHTPDTTAPIYCPPEYRPLVAVAEHPPVFARIGYVMAALRRELDWHHAAAAGSSKVAERRAATVCEIHVREAVTDFLSYVDLETVLDALRSKLIATSVEMDGVEGPWSMDIDADQLAYRADAASRIALISRNLAATF